MFSLVPIFGQITYKGGDGPGKGKHIVFVASDHEYRAEETCPALARILAQHQGFKTTVLFGPFPCILAILKASAISNKATVPEPSSSAPLLISPFSIPI